MTRVPTRVLPLAGTLPDRRGLGVDSMRAGRGLTAVLAVIALATGCGGSGSATNQPRALPKAETQVVSQDLTFTGLMAGHVTSAKTGPKFSCGTPTFPDVFTVTDLEITLRGHVWKLGITAEEYSGPGRADDESTITLADAKDSTVGYLSDDHKTELTFGEDGRSGTTDADLFRQLSDTSEGGSKFDDDVRGDNDASAGGKSGFHVKGTWHCP